MDWNSLVLESSSYPQTPRPSTIVIVGDPSSGKTTLGKELAKVLGSLFIDVEETLNEYILQENNLLFAEALSGKTIDERITAEVLDQLVHQEEVGFEAM